MCLWFSICGLAFVFQLPKFDFINVDVPVCKRGHNLETRAKLNKARHSFSNEVSVDVGADFQLIPSKEARKRTRNVHPCMQFYFIEKKTKNVSWDFYDQVLKSPPYWQMSARFSLPQKWLMTTWNKQMFTILAQNSVAVSLFKGQNTRALKRIVCKLLWFLLLRRFCRQNWYFDQHYTSSISRYFL